MAVAQILRLADRMWAFLHLRYVQGGEIDDDQHNLAFIRCLLMMIRTHRVDSRTFHE